MTQAGQARDVRVEIQGLSTSRYLLSSSGLYGLYMQTCIRTASTIYTSLGGNRTHDHRCQRQSRQRSR